MIYPIFTRYTLYIFFFISLIQPVFASEKPSETKPTIYVSVQPYVDIVQKLVGEKAHVSSIVSSSMSSHTFEPTPKSTLNMKNGLIWFGIGERFESKLYDVLSNSLHSKIIYINLKSLIKNELLELLKQSPELHTSCSCGHHHDTPSTHNHDPDIDYVDPHIWMSPSLMALQVKKIADEITVHAPAIYSENLDTNLKEILFQCHTLSEKAQSSLRPQAGKSILTAHPAYSYLLSPFGIEQYAIEEEGKEPSPKALTHLIAHIQKENITTIFTQAQYPSKGAEVLLSIMQQAESHNSYSKQKNKRPVIVQLDPYSHNYISAMNTIIEEIAKALQDQEPS